MLRRDFVRAVIAVGAAPKVLLSQQTTTPATPLPAPVPSTGAESEDADSSRRGRGRWPWRTAFLFAARDGDVDAAE